MKQLALDMAQGKVCYWCGKEFEQQHNYPVVCQPCYDSASRNDKRGTTQATYRLKV